MTGINHALTGAVIGTWVGQPLLAIPLAFASHFVLDVLPHFGQNYEERTKIFKAVVGVDIALLALLFSNLALRSEWLMTSAAVTAMSPDFAWIYRFTIKEHFGTLPKPPLNKFNQFHVGIQKLESMGNLIFEIVWLFIVGAVLVRIV